jgi:hypothetical protein
MHITSLLESKDGTIWAGTELNGVLRYDGTTWQAITVSDGLPSNFVSAILEDSHGNLWFGTGNGIGVYKPNNNPPVLELTNPKEQVIQIGTAYLFIGWRAGDVETPTNRLTYQYKLDEGSWTKPTTFAFTTLTELGDGKHIFSVRAIDGDLNKSKPATLTIIVDTIQPIVVITNPKRGGIVVGAVEITGTVLDADLKEYWVQYGSGDSPEKWIQIGGRGAKAGRDMRVATWDTSGIPTGKYTIRLAAVDILGHERYDDVVVQAASASDYIIKAEGGYVGKPSDKVNLYIPPNALKQDTQITITVVEDASVVMCADIGPAETILMKPVTLTFHYDDKSVQGMNEMKLAVFYWNGTDWKRIGGTVDAKANKITTVITRFGRYAVKEDLSADVGKPTITEVNCQPRIFSPKGGGFDTRTAISFNLAHSAPVTIKIYNRAGKLKRLLEENKDMSRGVNVVYWDGRDDDKDIIASDLYIVTITAGDATVTKTVAVSNR